MKRSEIFETGEMTMSEQELDAKLAEQGQMEMRRLVQSMSEETLSLSWRSQLNETLLARVAARQRRRRFTWFVSPALGLGVAGALAFVWMARTPEVRNPIEEVNRPQIEESLVATYQDTLRYTDITGVGLNPDEVVNRRTLSATADIVEVSLDSL